MRQLHKEGVRPPKDSPFFGSWGEKGEDWVFQFSADGTMTITKPSGEVMKGTWVHEKKTDDTGLTAVYRIGDYATTMWLQKGKLVISGGDTWSVYPRTIPATPKPAEQDSAGQPAIRSESDSEGGDKHQPESEGRSR